MQFVLQFAYFLVFLYVIVMLVRLVLEWVQVFSRDWRPQGLVLVIAEAVYTITDPPLRFLRERIKPIRLGAVALDVSFIIVMLACFVLMSLLTFLAAAVA